MSVGCCASDEDGGMDELPSASAPVGGEVSIKERTMSDHLRFTPEDYQTLLETSRTINLGGSLGAFQAALADVLRRDHAALATFIARLRKEQVRLLLGHLRGGQPAPQEPDDCDLSYQEWQAVSRACEMIWLHGDAPDSFPDQLVRQVAELAPSLAAKLVRFNETQFAMLYRRVKTGNRW
jgi:hypothetical protein